MHELERIIRLERVAQRRMRVYFADGMVRDVEFWRFARKGTLLEQLSHPEFAASCHIADKGHALRWPGGIDFSSGALARAGRLISSPLSPDRSKPGSDGQQPERAARGLS